MDDQQQPTIRWATVAIFDRPFEAHLAKNLLQARGIAATLCDENTSGLLWHMTMALGGVKLQVPEDQLQAAVDALDNRSPEDDEATADTNSALPTLDDGDHPGSIDESEIAAETELRDVGDESEFPSLSRREQDAGRAVKAAIAGLMLFPFAFYSFYLVLKVLISDEPLAPSFRKQAWVATAICFPTCIMVGVFLRTI